MGIAATASEAAHGGTGTVKGGKWSRTLFFWFLPLDIRYQWYCTAATTASSLVHPSLIETPFDEHSAVCMAHNVLHSNAKACWACAEGNITRERFRSGK